MASSFNPRDRRPSERVGLGRRVTVIAEDQERKRRQSNAVMRVANAHGGPVRRETERQVEQPSLLGNPENNAEQACRAVRVGRATSEFATTHLKFWPVVFPPEDWAARPIRQARQTWFTRNSFRSAVFDRLRMVSVRRTLS